MARAVRRQIDLRPIYFGHYDLGPQQPERVGEKHADDPDYPDRPHTDHYHTDNQPRYIDTHVHHDSYPDSYYQDRGHEDSPHEDKSERNRLEDLVDELQAAVQSILQRERQVVRSSERQMRVMSRRLTQAFEQVNKNLAVLESRLRDLEKAATRRSTK